MQPLKEQEAKHWSIMPTLSLPMTGGNVQLGK